MRPYLSSPGKIGALTVKNRVIMEAMGNALSNLDGSMSAEDIAFYEARAKGGAGLIMSEAVSVSSNSGRANPRNLCIDDDKLIPGYCQLMDVLRPYGCAFFVELYHPGRQGDSALNGGRRMFAPSAIQCGLTRQPVIAMTTEEIACMVQKFINGAIRCQKAGVDGVLIHAAHGYLINQFLRLHQPPHRLLWRLRGQSRPLRSGDHPRHSGCLRAGIPHCHPHLCL